MDDLAKDKIRQFKLAKTIAGDGEDIHFYLMMFDYLKLSPESRLALGLARGRRKYFVIGK